MLHERETGRLARVIDSGGGSVRAPAFAPSGRLLAALALSEGPGRGTRPPFLGVWDADTGREVRRLEGVTGAPAFSPDGRGLVAARAQGRVRLWEIATGREWAGLPQEPFHPLAFSPDGRVLACGDANGVILWELAAGKERCRVEALRIESDRERPVALRFSPDGRWLAWGEDRAVRLADVLGGRVVHVFWGHDSGVKDLAFTPDSRALASASYDSTVLIWDVAAVAARQGRPAAPDGKAAETAWGDLADAASWSGSVRASAGDACRFPGRQRDAVRPAVGDRAGGVPGAAAAARGRAAHERFALRLS